MTRRTLHGLVAIVAGLVLLLVVLENSDRNVPDDTGQVLLPGFSDVANDAERVEVSTPAGENDVTLRRARDRWVVSERDDYPADMSRLRQLMIALAEAEIVERKTSDPERYDRLGVGDPADGGNGSRVSISGPDFEYGVIVGNAATGDSRYVRPDGSETSYLVDRDPGLPESLTDWLAPDVLDIDAGRVRSVAIVHADGETIVIEKNEESQDDFDVLDIPGGRELRYATIANNIAGALGGLKLEDVRAAGALQAESTARFETWDGLVVTAETGSAGSDSWVTFSAQAEADAGDAGGAASAINERVTGWQYRLPTSKYDLLTRRWDDLLKAVDDGE